MRDGVEVEVEKCRGEKRLRVLGGISHGKADIFTYIHVSRMYHVRIPCINSQRPSTYTNARASINVTVKTPLKRGLGKKPVENDDCCNAHC